MNKTLCIAVILLGMIAVSNSRSAGAPTGIHSPVVVAHGRLTNQTPPTDTTTIFTPAQTGLYRLSVYVTVTKPVNGGEWNYILSWTDDAGAEETNNMLSWYGGSTPSHAFATPGLVDWPGNTVTFEAVGGVPVTYWVPGNADGSMYSLYYTVERL